VASPLIYITDGNSINVYDSNPAAGTINEAPLATIATSVIVRSGIAVDASGKIYVTSSDDSSIIVYPANPRGAINGTPLATIKGSNTGLERPGGIALDASGNIYVTNSLTLPGNVIVGSINVYPANPVGVLNEAPLATISGSNTGLNPGPSGIALDSSGKIYAVSDSGMLNVFAGHPSGALNEAPLATYADVGYESSGVAVDAKGTIYATSASGGSGGHIDIIYAANQAGASGSEAPELSGNITASGVALDASGKIYVANPLLPCSTCSAIPNIAVYAANPTTNEAPLETITGSNTQLGNLTYFGIAVH
jgi:hypothetical protein